MQDALDFIVTGWRNGPSKSATGYGLKVSRIDRDLHFKPEWKEVSLIVDGLKDPILVNIGKRSFWNGTCRELISKQIKDWMMAQGLIPWPARKPPKFVMSPLKPTVFKVVVSNENNGGRG